MSYLVNTHLIYNKPNIHSILIYVKAKSNLIKTSLIYVNLILIF